MEAATAATTYGDLSTLVMLWTVTHHVPNGCLRAVPKHTAKRGNLGRTADIKLHGLYVEILSVWSFEYVMLFWIRRIKTAPVSYVVSHSQGRFWFLGSTYTMDHRNDSRALLHK